MKKKKNNINKKIRKEWKNIIFNIIFGVLTLLIASFFYKNIILATSLLIIVTVIGLIKWKSKITIIIFILGAIWGPISEMIAIYLGAWNYSYPNFINIPIWLFFVWGNAAAFIYQTAIEIKKLGIKK